MRSRLLFSMITLGMGAVACGSPDASQTGVPTSAEQTASKPAQAAQADSDANQDPIALANKAADAALHLITRVKTPNGGILEFYEPTEGEVLVSEAGGENSTPTKGLNGKLPTEMYAAVAPNSPIPAELTAAQEKAIAAGAVVQDAVNLVPHEDSQGPTATPSGARTPSTGPSGELGRQGVAPEDTFCSFSWLKANDPSGYVYADCNNDGTLGYTWCWADTGPGSWTSGTNLTGDNAIACVESGSNITMSVSRSGGQYSASWSIPSPGWRWYSHTAPYSSFPYGHYSKYNYNGNISGSWGDIQYVGGFYFNG
ncbi:MAG TPA: hypothetical protein VHC69_20950 [Polyangiaceae bacterium]|nr:hypothetical protein [Polyangiaceae bacterium]